MTVHNVTRETVLADAERWALSASDRTRGLLDADALAAGQALVISPCSSVHMIGMRFPLDVVFVDQGDRVVALHPHLKPGRWTRIHLRARRAIELPVGVIAASQTHVGDELRFEPLPESANSPDRSLLALLALAVLSAVGLVLVAR